MNIEPQNKKLVSVLAGIAAIIILIAIWDKWNDNSIFYN